ncbi:Hsp70-binding protein 1 [Taenia solium]|eukprot:TsM_000663600 transcript=TsM_000663600 gene=TsM_000663600
MSRIPHDLKGLLRFCLDAGSDPTSDTEPMDPERALWLRQALESITVDLAAEMRKRIAVIIQNISSADPKSLVEETTSALDDLIDFTEDVNLADTYLKIGGIALLKALLGFPSGDYRAQSGMLLSNIVQNHEDAQKVAISENLLNLVLQLLIEDSDPGNMSGLLSGISSLVRGSELSQKRFIQCKGFDRLFELLEKTSRSNEQEKYDRFNEKASFFIYCLCQELSEEQLANLKDFHLSERIAQLILRFHLPSEFLVKALVLLLNGRVPTLIHSPPDPVSDPASLVKVPISEDSRKLLLDWLKSPKAQDETLISSEARQDLTKALL